MPSKERKKPYCPACGFSRFISKMVVAQFLCQFKVVFRLSSKEVVTAFSRTYTDINFFMAARKPSQPRAGGGNLGTALVASIWIVH